MTKIDLALKNLFNMFPKMKAGRGASSFLGVLTRDSLNTLNLNNSGTKVPRFIYHLTSKKMQKVYLQMEN